MSNNNFNKEDVIQVLKQVVDPELNIDIWMLGLIYGIEIDETKINIRMTYTTPLCPFGPAIKNDVISKIKNRFNIEPEIKITLDPPWEMSQELRTMLGV